MKKIEDPFAYIEKLIDRDDGHNESLTAARNKLIRGDLEGALTVLRLLPRSVLSLGCVVADPKRNALIPDESAIPDFILKPKSAKAEPAKPEPAKGAK